MIIDPAEPDPVAYDREHVIVLSDWTFLHPHQLVTKLKAEGGYFNRQKQTVFGMLRGGPEESMSAADRAMWGQMRMDPADIADVTASTYTYLVNGHGPQENWTGLFGPGERVRQIGRARVCTPVTNAHLVCRLRLENKTYRHGSNT